MNEGGVGRPPSFHKGKTFLFILWDENRCELNKLKKGTMSEEINLALQQYFRFKGKIEQDILFQIEENQKIIERHQGIINNLNEELGKQEKEKEDQIREERDMLDAKEQRIRDMVKNWANPEVLIGKNVDNPNMEGEKIKVTKEFIRKYKPDYKKRRKTRHERDPRRIKKNTPKNH